MALAKLPISSLSKNVLKLCLPSSNSPLPLGVQSVCCFHTSLQLSAGHAKWQNIKHIKAAKDGEKASVASSLARELKLCLTKFPNPDPNVNTQLAALIQKAKKNSVSKEVIQRAIDKVVALKDPKNISAFDARGMANTAIVIEAFSPRPAHTRNQLQAIIKKFGFNINQSASDLFENTGHVAVSVPEEEASAARADPENFNIDKYVDLAIEIGAEDVSLEPGAEGPFLQFVCHPNDVSKVARGLEEQGCLTVESADPVYRAITEVPVSQEFLDNVDRMVEKLETMEEFIKIYTNLVPEETSS